LPLVRVNDVSARAVLASSMGTFFAATASGVYRRTRTDTAWKKVNDGLASPKIYSLAEAPDGSLLAGGIGAVFRSGDQGESWEFLTGPVQLKVTKQGKDETTYTAAAPLQLPPVGVRCLAANSTGVFAGTDSGAYFIAPGGSWTPVAIIPGEQVPVTALFTASDGTIFAGTSKGIFRLSGKSWTAANSGLPSPPSDPVVFAPGVA